LGDDGVGCFYERNLFYDFAMTIDASYKFSSLC